MEKVMELYKKHREELANLYKELMNKIKSLSDDNTSDDEDMREFIKDLMGQASYISDCITISDCKIRTLTRQLRKA